MVAGAGLGNKEPCGCPSISTLTACLAGVGVWCVGVVAHVAEKAQARGYWVGASNGGCPGLIGLVGHLLAIGAIPVRGYLLGMGPVGWRLKKSPTLAQLPPHSARFPPVDQLMAGAASVDILCFPCHQCSPDDDEW